MCDSQIGHKDLSNNSVQNPIADNCNIWQELKALKFYGYHNACKIVCSPNTGKKTQHLISVIEDSAASR